MPSITRQIVIERVRDPDRPSNWVDQVRIIGQITKTGVGASFQRNITTYANMGISLPEDRSAPVEITNEAELQAAVAAFQASHHETIVHKMIVYRVRNPDDSTQFVDDAVTTSYVIERSAGGNLTEDLNVAPYIPADDADIGTEFEVRSKADLLAGIAAFQAAHPT